MMLHNMKFAQVRFA